jgi:hypothetical protein
MERAIFLIESRAHTDTMGSPARARVECMVNPSEVVLRRTAGVVPQRSLAPALGADDAYDDPLLLTGGGRTELFLELLFDLTMSGQANPVADVRELTAHFWELTRSRAGTDDENLPRVRFIWGRAWNFLAVIAALSERLEHFDSGGAPRRSWLRMQLLRVADRVEPMLGSDAEPILDEEQEEQLAQDGDEETGDDLIELHRAADRGEVLPSEQDAEPAPSTWLMELAERVLGSASRWREIASQNDVEDPLCVPPGTVLRVSTNRIGAP